MNEAVKMTMLSGFASLCKLPFMRGGITISEFLYYLCQPKTDVVCLMVGDIPVKLNLSDPQGRFIYFGA
jgi:hypothetical protein